MGLKGVRKSGKNPAIFSHEFIIQNHADIVSCVAMVFVLGLMFQATAYYASFFVAMSHNATITSYEDLQPDEELPKQLYTNGRRDMAAIFFYCLIAIVVQAVIQEYVLDKVTKKLHLSKSKHNRFNECGQLVVFSLASAAWAAHLIIKDNVLNEISSLWVGYPKEHAEMTFQLKFFFVLQLAYWMHCYPELYFTKVKKDDIPRKIQYASLYLFFVAAAYIMNFTHIALVLLFLRYAEESVLHVCRLLHFSERTTYSNTGFKVWNVLFVISRLLSIILTILTFHYGLATLEDQTFDVATGNFNTPLIRLNVLFASCLIQGYLMWQFINFHLRRSREKQASGPKPAKLKDGKYKGKGNWKDKGKKKAEQEYKNLPEADQNTRRRK